MPFKTKLAELNKNPIYNYIYILHTKIYNFIYILFKLYIYMPCILIWYIVYS